MASPLGPKIIENGSPLFVFLVGLAAGNANVVTHYSSLMYELGRVMLPTGARNGNLHLYLPYILRALVHYGLADTEMVLMAFATIRAESVTMVPVSEGASRFNSSPGALRHERGTHLFDLYDTSTKLGNRGAPDGANYRVRGFVQLTGRSNYDRYGTALGWPLLQQPEIANDPWDAAVLLARYLRNHERQIRSALRRGDLRAARRAVNGGAHGLGDFSKAMSEGRAFLQQHYIAGEAVARAAGAKG